MQRHSVCSVDFVQLGDVSILSGNKSATEYILQAHRLLFHVSAPFEGSSRLAPTRSVRRCTMVRGSMDQISAKPSSYTIKLRPSLQSKERPSSHHESILSRSLRDRLGDNHRYSLQAFLAIASMVRWLVKPTSTKGSRTPRTSASPVSIPASSELQIQ